MKLYIEKMAQAAVLLVGLLLISSSCDDNNSSSGINIQSTTSNLEQGTWRVTYFFDDTDETHHFTGYTFTFQDAGTIVATNGSNTVNGTWAIQNSSNGQVKLIMDFGAIEPFDELNDDWKIIESKSARIKLEDVSGGSGETDYLTLERI